MIACATHSVTTSASVTLLRGVPGSLGQEIVGRDEHGREQQVEVGVHRGPQGRRCDMSTADFDPAASVFLANHTNTTTAVESIIYKATFATIDSGIGISAVSHSSRNREVASVLASHSGRRIDLARKGHREAGRQDVAIFRHRYVNDSKPAGALAAPRDDKLSPG